jgi:hypothetical protein
LEEQDVIGLEHQILDEEGSIAFELGVFGEECRIDGEPLHAIDQDAVSFAAFAPGLGLVALLLGGVIGRSGALGRSGTVGGEWGLALFPLEASDLVFEALVLLAQGQDFGVEELDEVEETNNGVARGRVGNAVEVQVQVEVEVGHFSPPSGATVGREERSPGAHGH